MRKWQQGFSVISHATDQTDRFKVFDVELIFSERVCLFLFPYYLNVERELDFSVSILIPVCSAASGLDSLPFFVD